MRALIFGGIVALAVAGGVARSQETAKPDAHAMMTGQHNMMAAMQASNKTLDALVAELNAAKGNDRIDKLVAVVNELVAERKQMRMMMMQNTSDEQHHK
jgi:hypothetical protein